ncbi:pleiotropic regulatory protein RsmS [Arsenophonus nasoniae]|uniref:Pleiotropic regulatory protein RsmS n=1 Tax=Arsenophonus nasoniae TaxID=638 RepID=D2TWE2_9GAMM|nr:pleiotropic regulatory protein RsmS [Arsenophonus nasoniae]QBY44871.1 hypothetical protein ArsFIN_34580 [Arsenophonus nasoniae]WGL94571.1 pleiotropic regulatory protein RsmS [Arsenophonus nasoniae]WGM01029.1 pleiotropic regulatory protein RsmS [Arsenophonus nasoniae]WGM05117.1 pleiotropic regulatory protein RsmS [Arsenophonus nasoniae]WGM10129.1 pleiotropic regulatory protein RsmS [Arsenophonus nasoniae]
MNLENAPLEIQVAIDLIYLLEINQIEPTTALKALDIVKKDYENKKAITSLTNATKKR